MTGSREASPGGGSGSDGADQDCDGVDGPDRDATATLISARRRTAMMLILSGTPDDDGDGSSCEGDCDDQDPHTFPEPRTSLETHSPGLRRRRPCAAAISAL